MDGHDDINVIKLYCHLLMSLHVCDICAPARSVHREMVILFEIKFQQTLIFVGLRVSCHLRSFACDHINVLDTIRDTLCTESTKLVKSQLLKLRRLIQYPLFHCTSSLLWNIYFLFVTEYAYAWSPNACLIWMRWCLLRHIYCVIRHFQRSNWIILIWEYTIIAPGIWTQFVSDPPFVAAAIWRRLGWVQDQSPATAKIIALTRSMSPMKIKVHILACLCPFVTTSSLGQQPRPETLNS